MQHKHSSSPAKELANVMVSVILTVFPEIEIDALEAGTLHSLPVSVPVPPGVTDWAMPLPWAFTILSRFEFFW